ncbi:dihydrolipoyl dehydrogenase [Mycolicibacterium canariasense]|nr:dihydrolipoyl dehydrogenase [Mycolicibacterium canariasense]MCV7213184.1 dihydrolipoyl dehydrogenase [Mycolicibacterium canariasense]ORV00901.1 dihydrolipoamide dehydrogenase [Mycolicibacterium canariasense]
MDDTFDFDLIVLGGGSGGYAAALRAAELGMRVAIIEKDKLGGTCLHRGCIPTKALLQSAEVAETVRESAHFGIQASLDHIDTDGVRRYRDGVVDALFRGLSGLVAGRGIALIAGTGRLTSPTTVTVTLPDGGERTLAGAHIVVATGSVPRHIPGVTADGRRIITSDDALNLDAVPRSAIVLGGGAIGCEFATVWHAFGADVTIVEAFPHLVPLEDEAAGRSLEKAFTRQGISLRLGAKVTDATPSAEGVTVTLDDGSALSADLVLVAIGRAPVTEGIGLENVGLETDRGYLKVDEHCRTSVPSIFAVGDVIPTLALAHVGFAEGIMVAETLAGLNPAAIDYLGIPRVTYSHPEVASVGLTTKVATERGYEVDEAVYDLAGNGKARILGASGIVKVVAARGGPVLGVHMVGKRVGELISEAQLIVNWDARPDEVAQHIHAHPTLSEAVGEAHLALAGKPLHTHS